MSRKSPSAMTATELVTARTQARWEQWIEARGCSFSLLVGVAVALLPWWEVHSTFRDRITGGVIYFFLVYLVLLGATGIRTYPCRREIQHRFGEGPFGERMLGLAKMLEQAETTDWILVLRGMGLPHGSGIDITLEIRSIGDARLVVESSPFATSSPGNSKIVETFLPADRISPIIELLSSNSLSMFRDVDHFVRDGFPCQIGILRNRSSSCQRARANLVCLPAQFHKEPTVLLAFALLELAGEGGAPTEIG